jgi:putative peptide zinc metalloprotease protein
MNDVATLAPPAPADSGSADDDGLRLDDGVELLGQYQGSGLREAPYLIRRSDGQVIQVSHLIYLIATALRPDAADLDRVAGSAEHLRERTATDRDTERPSTPPGRVDLDRVAGDVSDGFGREVTADNVAYLVRQKLVPAGIVRPAGGAGGAGGDGAPATGEVARAKPLLALRMRVPLVPARAHRAVTRALVPLLRLPIVLAALAGLVAFDLWLLQRSEALAWGVRGVIYQPKLLLMVTLLTLVAAAFHELGHAAAARRGGAHPGAMGAGIYLVWPVFYTDVSDSYRLSRRGRLRTDLGGVYFNVLFTLGLAGVYAVTGFEPLLVSVVITQAETLRQFLPFVRLDGYYVVSDLAGVPNLFAYMRPVLVGLLRRRDDEVRREARATLGELHPGARTLIIAWVAITTPVLLFNLVVLLVVAPRLAGAAWGSAGGQIRAMVGPDGALDPFRVANGVIGVFLLALPVLGMGYIAVRFVGRARALARAWWRNRPIPTAVALAAVSVVVVLQVALVWPDAFASALRHAEESPAVEDSPVQIAGPPVRPAPPAVAVTPSSPTTAPPAAPSSADESTSSGGGAERGARPTSSPSTTAAPTTTTEAPDDDTGRPGGADEGSSTTTTTTVPPSTSTSEPSLLDDTLGAVLGALFTSPV